MRNFLKFLAVAVAAVVTMATPMSPAHAQSPYLGIPSRNYVANINTALDAGAIFAIKYVCTGAAPTVAVEADSNLTFQVGGAAYTGFECPVAGALGGVIDVSDAACNTAGEVIDVINSDVNGCFKAVILNGLRSEDVSAATALLADVADNEVSSDVGEIVYREQAGDDDSYIPMWANNAMSKGIQPWLPVGATQVNPNPFWGTDTVLLYGHFNTTNAGAIGNIEVHCTVENYNSRGKSSETDTVLYIEAGAATGVTGKVDEFLNAGGLHCQGGKMWARELASGADTTANVLFATGYQERFRDR